MIHTMQQWLPFRGLVATLALALAAAVQAQDTVVMQGRVVDMRGQPVAVADVSIAFADHPEVVVGKTKADGDGMFRCRVPNQDVGKSWLATATAPGLCRSSAGTYSAEQPLRITLHDAVELHGTLVDPAGQRVVNAKVFARPTSFSLRGTGHVVTTDASGCFKGLSVAVGPTVVGAFVPGHGMQRADLVASENCEVKLAPADGPQTSIAFTIKGLPEGQRPSVMVRLLGGAGIPRLGLPPHLRELRIAGDSWRMECLPDCRYMIDARSSGYSMAPEVVYLKAGTGPHRVEFEVTPPSGQQTNVVAVVRDREGEPVAHAMMALTSFGTNERVRAWTDKNGRVTFATSLAAGSRAIIYPVGKWVIDRELKKARSGMVAHDCVVDPAKVLEVRVVAAGAVAGRVLSANRQPAVFAEVELRERSGDRIARWTTVETVTVDADGSFRFSPQVVRKSPVRVQVAGTLGSAIGDPFLIDEPGMQATDLELQLRPPSVVSGVVTQADGRPAVGVIVRLVYPDRDARELGRASRAEVITDKQGRYRISGVVPGKAELYVMQGHALKAAIEVLQVQEGETKRLDLKAAWLGR